MREESVASRYAAALFAASQKAGTVDATERDLQTVAEKMTANPILRALSQPVVAEDRKKLAAKSAFGESVQPLTLSFLNLLIDKRRIDLLPEMREEFIRLTRESHNVALATATSARPLTDEEARALTTTLSTRTGKRIQLKTEVDPTLLGGVLVRIGDTVYDGTVKGNLERLREQLLARR